MSHHCAVGGVLGQDPSTWVKRRLMNRFAWRPWAFLSRGEC